jgi:hypothetical protein
MDGALHVLGLWAAHNHPTRDTLQVVGDPKNSAPLIAPNIPRANPPTDPCVIKCFDAVSAAPMGPI